jgi:hypothetical protein
MKNKKASSEHHLTFAKNRYRDKHAPLYLIPLSLKLDGSG